MLNSNTEVSGGKPAFLTCETFTGEMVYLNHSTLLTSKVWKAGLPPMTSTLFCFATWYKSFILHPSTLLFFPTLSLEKKRAAQFQVALFFSMILSLFDRYKLLCLFLLRNALR